MIKLLILAGLAYVAYRAVKSALLGGMNTENQVDRQASGEIDDVMVKDPVCGAYFPRHQGVAIVKDGEKILFCSRECRDKFKRSES